MPLPYCLTASDMLHKHLGFVDAVFSPPVTLLSQKSPPGFDIRAATPPPYNPGGGWGDTPTPKEWRGSGDRSSALERSPPLKRPKVAFWELPGQNFAKNDKTLTFWGGGFRHGWDPLGRHSRPCPGRSRWWDTPPDANPEYPPYIEPWSPLSKNKKKNLHLQRLEHLHNLRK